MAFADVDDRDGLVAPWDADDREPGIEPPDDGCDTDPWEHERSARCASTRGYDS